MSGSTKSIHEIAQLAGVSASTVSRVINHNGRFSKETEKRVLRVIRENNYVPNMTAKGLRTNRTRIVGIIVPDITNPHFANLVLHMEKTLFQSGYSCMICNTNESEEVEKQHISALIAQNVRGIAMISGTQNYPTLSEIPVIYLDRRSHNISSRTDDVMIESDNEQGGYLATKELLRCGCKKIVILKCLKNDENQIARYNGYRRALAEYGITEDSGLLVDAAAISIPDARNSIAGILSSGTKFDGIMSTTDTMAVGAMIALREFGLCVPEDVMLTGFDDSPLAEVCGPGLTSVHQDTEGMAHLASSILLQMMEEEKKPQKAYYKLPVHLTIRHSTMK